LAELKPYPQLLWLRLIPPNLTTPGAFLSDGREGADSKPFYRLDRRKEEEFSTVSQDITPYLRDNYGRFAAGNRGGPGNPHAAAVGRLRKALYDSLTPEKVQKAADAIAEKAGRGDVPAAKVLLAYAVGRPLLGSTEVIADGTAADEWLSQLDTEQLQLVLRFRNEAQAQLQQRLIEAHILPPE
jgi:hypothetical protein